MTFEDACRTASITPQFFADRVIEWSTMTYAEFPTNAYKDSVDESGLYPSVGICGEKVFTFKPDTPPFISVLSYGSDPINDQFIIKYD